MDAKAKNVSAPWKYIQKTWLDIGLQQFDYPRYGNSAEEQNAPRNCQNAKYRAEKKKTPDGNTVLLQTYLQKKSKLRAAIRHMNFRLSSLCFGSGVFGKRCDNVTKDGK